MNYEKKVKCKYCYAPRGEETYLLAHKFQGLEHEMAYVIALDKSEVTLITEDMEEGVSVREPLGHINFCPICGRSLKEGGGI